MALRYFDRAGKEIAKKDWAILFRRPDYYTYRVTKVSPGIVIVTFSVGLAADFENPPKPYAVAIYWPTQKRSTRQIGDEVCWFATAEEALEAHEQTRATLEKQGVKK